MATVEMKTVAEVADDLGITAARVRQLCIRHSIGIHRGLMRFLTREDVQKLNSVRKPNGRPKKIS